jgi:hypothetical protein
VKSARAWKEYYARERERLGREGLERFLDSAPPVELPARGALVFPHTRLEVSGELVAACALACVRSRRETVVALGVLHGGRETDAPLVARARSGDPDARTKLRRVHGPGIPGDQGYWTEEFSLDGFSTLLELAASRLGRKPPRLLVRYPFLVGAQPRDLPGLEELHGLVAAGAALVATADPIHHGVGYGTPQSERRALGEPGTQGLARESIARGLEFLARGDFAGFLEHAAHEKSDFRDAGPVLAILLGEGAPLVPRVLALELVDYAAALEAPEPTWVAGALASLVAASKRAGP